ncbi:MAG: succinate dehydrogenase cytochrome b subunit [Elusimicrobiota bacterium]
MKLLLSLFTTSIGKKQFVAATGLLLIGFLLGHLTGNLLILKSPELFNQYADFLVHHPLIIPAEIGLVVLFSAHIVMGLKISIENWNARPDDYDYKVAEGGRTVGSATMKYSGLLTFVFLCVHLSTFKYSHPGATLYDTVVIYLKMPLYCAFYLLALTSLGIHLSHGIKSAFQTFGVSHPKYTPAIGVAGLLLAVAVTAGFLRLALHGIIGG